MSQKFQVLLGPLMVSLSNHEREARYALLVLRQAQDERYRNFRDGPLSPVLATRISRWRPLLHPPLPDSRPSGDVLAACCLLGAAVIFYYPLVFMGRAIVDYDAFVFFYPQRAYLAESLRAGHLPLWDPYLFMGAPFLANPQTAVLYPPSWLFVLSPVATGYTVQLVLHVCLAAVFTYCLGRLAFRLSILGSAVGALAYAFSGFVVGQTGHLNQLSAAAWLPAVLLAYDRAVHTRQPRWVGLGGAALGLQILAGHPQIVYMTLIVLALFGLVRAPWRDPAQLVWAAAVGAAVGALGAALSAAQLLPTLELTPLSIRGGGVQWEDAVAGSLPTYLAVRALLPPFWLDVASTEYLGYVGVVPLTLGFLAVLVVRSRFVVLGVALCALGLFLALGQNNGSYRWFFDTVPGFGTFRVPARWLFLWQTGVSVLAALAADWIERGARMCARRRDLWPRAVAVAMILAMGLAWQREFGEPLPLRRTLAAWAGLAAAVVMVGALANLKLGRVAATMLVGLTAAELWAAAGVSPARLAPPAWLDSPGVAATWLRRYGTPAGRVLSAARADYVSDDEDAARAALDPLPERVVQSLLVAWKWRDTLAPNLPLQFQLRSADGYDGGVLPLGRFVQLSSLVVAAPRPDGVLQSRLDRLPDARVLDLLGVGYLLANENAAAPAGADAVDLGSLRLYGRGSSAPLSIMLFRSRTTAVDTEAVAELADPSFDPNGEVILASEQATGSLESGPAGMAVEPDAADGEHWHARIVAPAAGYLLQREAWYPGWRARVDGVEVPILRADVLFRAVAVPPGEHEVQFFFDSGSFRRGALVSALGLLAVALLVTARWWLSLVPIMPRRGRTRPSGPRRGLGAVRADAAGPGSAAP